jgi:ABC-type branched-subunit amino acid transport system ATPase component
MSVAAEVKRDEPAPRAAIDRILAVHNIEVVYDHVILVLKGVSLAVPRGGIVALLGANGAGKTTTLKAISNLLHSERGEVTKGSIVFDGEEVQASSPNELVRRGCIQVMEGRQCFGHLTVDENLLTGAFARREEAPPSSATWRRSTAISRASRSVAMRWRATLRAASSRCARSAAR